MGWGNAGEIDGRPIGYFVAAVCDEKGCKKKIDRGLAYVCGRMHGGEDGCGGYFCASHLFFAKGSGAQKCSRCLDERLDEIEATTTAPPDDTKESA